MRQALHAVRQSAPMDTTNDFGALTQGQLVVFTRPIGQAITKPAARRLAAHLMALADDSQDHWAVGAILEAIEDGS